MLNILVRIDNYDPLSTYRVNLMRHESMIAMMTEELDINEGPDTVFKDVPSGYAYDAEVIKFCADGVRGTTRKPINTVSAPVGCSCPSNYEPTPDNSKCVRTLTAAPTIEGAVLGVAPGPNEIAYNNLGILVYAPGYATNGTGATAYASGSSHPYWSCHATLTDGRLNIAGVWNDADASLPLDEWIGFSRRIYITEAKVYFVGMAGDNYIRMKVNGVVLIDQREIAGAPVSNFNYWHCYPVYLNAGENFIEMQGWNDGTVGPAGPGCFAAEIYDCDLAAIQNVTPATEATLNRIFSTIDESVFTNNYSCQEGYALDMEAAGGPICKKIDYTDCIA